MDEFNITGTPEAVKELAEDWAHEVTERFFPGDWNVLVYHYEVDPFLDAANRLGVEVRLL